MKAELIFPPSIESSFAWVAGIGAVRVGVHQNHQWYIDVDGAERLIQTPGDTMPLLPLLEVGRVVVFEHLIRIELNQPELIGVAKSFPESLLLQFAFDSSFSEYWPLKALDWLVEEPVIDPKVKESLCGMLNHRWVTQKLKQRARKMMGRKESD